MQTEPHYYQASGQFNTLGFSLALFICIASATVGAYMYTMMSTINPFIYFNVLLAIFFGLAIGAFVNIMAWLTKLRNDLSRYILAGFTALFAIYFMWVAFVLSASMGRMPSFTNLYLDNLGMIADQQAFFGIIELINIQGMWEVFGMQFNGFLLSLIWVIEIALIIGGAIYYIRKNPLKPYAEDENKWYDKYTLTDQFSSIGSASLLTPKLLANATVALQEMGNGTAWKYSTVFLFYLPEAKKQYLSVERVYIADRGEGSTEKENLIQYLAIDTQAAKHVLDTFSHTKAGWM